MSAKTAIKELPDRWVTCPRELSFEIQDLMEDGDRTMRNPDGTPLTYSWRKMIMGAVMTDHRLMEEPLLLDHIERAELCAIARGGPGETVRVGARALECLQKVLLTSPTFDVRMGVDGSQIMHGYIAQQPPVQAWIRLLLDAPSEDPRTIVPQGARTHTAPTTPEVRS